MTIFATLVLTASVASSWIGAAAPAASTQQLVGVLLGLLLFCMGAFLLVAQAAGWEPVPSEVEPWGSDDV